MKIKVVLRGCIAKLIDQIDARGKWWKSITEEYRIHYVTTEKSLAFRMNEFIIKANLLNLNIPKDLVKNLLDFTSEFFLNEAQLLPLVLAEKQITELQQFIDQVLLEY